jgi:3-hydroxyisobutyrate dehydrogenase
MTSEPTIAFLGLGRMGQPMAMNLVRAGFHVRVWNRTLNRTDVFAAEGGVPAATPADATRGADIVITMLADGPAVRGAMVRREGGLEGADSRQCWLRGGASPTLHEAVWVQMSTVGAAWTRLLAQDAAAYGVRFVDAPVSGSEGSAKSGDLVILASGPADLHDKLAPVFDAMGRRTFWLGEAGAGTSAKLVLNNLLVGLTEATAEALTFAASLGVDPADIVELLSQTPLGSPYTVQKARAMLAADFRPAFALKHAIKDAGLALDAAHDSDTTLTLTEALLPGWRDVAASGHADDDLAAVYTRTAA